MFYADYYGMNIIIETDFCCVTLM